MPNSSPSLDSIFAEAIDLPDADRRVAYLDQACGSSDLLRCRVEALVKAHFRAGGSFLEQGVANGDSTIAFAPAPDEFAGPELGSTIGPYTLREQIGEGGMGLVYLAEQMQPVRRKVALKLIKPGMDSRQVVARFEAERQALALMDHPNIAKVYDAGTTPEGRPYFVMELVKGEPLTHYCDRNQLNLRQRLELFLQVCQAVQHAHQKGVIHRDLKPSNILIAVHDVTPVAKVIDFGIAKAVGQSLTDKTVYTAVAQFVGTPLYMSPEQAGQSSLDVDTRTDVYALGVLLYELLTGTTPIDPETLRKAGLDEVRRIIREDEPPRPSARMSTLKAAALSTVADKRGADPRRLARQVRGELDWVVMKCLEKDRNRRYETASALAADVQRYLNDEQVQACPASAGYRFRKFVRRNKTGLTMTGAVVAFLLILGGGLGWITRDQAARRLLANENVRAALDVAEARLADGNPYAPDLVTAVRKAEAQPDAELVSAELRTRLNRVQADLAMLGALEQARLEMTAVADNHFDHERTTAGYARAFREYGIDVAALPPHEAAALVRERTIALYLVAALHDWAGLLLGTRRTTEAEHLLAVGCAADADPWRNRLRQALASKDGNLLEELARAAPVDQMPATSLLLLARSLKDMGRQPAAMALLERAQRRFLADFWTNHDLAVAFLFARPARPAEAVGFFRAAVALRPDSPCAHLNLGFALEKQEKLDEAIACYKEAIRLRPDFAFAHNNLGNALNEQGKLDEAITSFQEALRLQPDSYHAHNNIGTTLKDQGKLDEAIAHYNETIRLRPDHAEPHTNLGDALHEQGKLEEAVVCHREALRLQPEFSIAHNNLGLVLQKQGKLEKAIASYQEAIRFEPGHPFAYNNLGNVLSEQGKLDEAIARYKEAIRLRPKYPEAHYNLGNKWRVQGNLKEAITSYRQAIKLKPNYTDAHYNLGMTFAHQGKLDDAIACYKEAIRLEPNCFDSHHNLGNAYSAKKQPDQAIAAYSKAIELKKDCFEPYYGMAEVYIRVIKQPDRAIAPLRQAIALKKDHFYAHVNLGMVYRETGNYEEARAALQKALQLASKNPGLAQEAAAYIKEMEQHQLVQTQLKTLAKVGQAQEFKGQLTKTDPLLDGKHSKIYPLQLKAGKHYLIDLMSSEFDTYLMVKNAAGKLIAEEDNSGQGTDSKLLFVPETDGEYTIVVLAFEAAATGSYTLRIQEYQPAKREKPPMD